MREGVLYLVRIYMLKGVDLDSQEPVANRQVSYEESVNNSRRQSVARLRKTEDIKDPLRADNRGPELSVTRKIVITTSSVGNKRV
jgi:hypothetical protein